MKNLRAHKEGSVLLMAIVLVAVLGIGAAAVWQYLHVTLRETGREERTSAAMYLAESGVEHALALIARDPSTAVSIQQAPLGKGRYSVTVRALDPLGRVAIDGVGEVMSDDEVLERRVVHVEALLRPGASPTIREWRREREKP
ncbi:MAG: hypothetical protein HYV26_20980 [Candidatus Hydrogenedentes bacterium]|nr:hypothetical protein [Candidatus Hydrogenedentota bacterium]